MTARLTFGSVLGWAVLVLLLALYGAGGHYSPYLLLLLVLIATPYIVAVRGGRPLIPDLSARGFLVAFALLALAFSLAAEQPSDVLILANFIWLLLFVPIQAVLKRVAGPNAGVVIARLALLGTALTLSLAIYDFVVFSPGRVGFLTSDPIRIANMAVVLGFVSLLGLIADRGWMRSVYLLGPVFAVGVAILASTRGALVSAAAISVVAIFVLIPNRRIAIWATVVAAAGAFGVVALAAQLGIGRVDSVFRTVWEVVNGQPVSDYSASIRVAMLRASLAAFAESPWFGHGWQRLITAVLPHLPAGQENLLQGQPHLHNDIADFAVGGGVIGLLAYATILLTPLVAAWRSTRDALYRVRLAGVALLTASYAALGLNAMMFGYEILTAMFFGLSAVLLGFCREASSIVTDSVAPPIDANPSRGRVERATVWALLALGLVLVTIVGLITPYLIVAIGLWLWLVLLATGRLPASYGPLPAKLLLVAFAMLVVVFTLTMRSVYDPFSAFNFTMLFLCGPLLWLFTRASSDAAFGRVVTMAAVGAGLTLLMMIYTVYAIYTSGDRPRGFNVGPIVVANAALALGVVATAGALALRNRASLLLPLALVAAIATVIVTQSRGPLIAVVPLLVLTGVFLWRVRLRSWLFVAGTGLAAASIAAAAVVFGGGRLAELPSLLMTFLGAGGERDINTEARLAMYEAGWQAFLQSPWIGHGWANLMKATLPHVDPAYLDVIAPHKQLHNDIVDFAVAGGVVGIGAYLVIIGTPLIAALRSARDRYWNARLYAASGVTIVYACGGLTDLMFGHEYHTALYVFLVAVIFGFFREAPNARLTVSPAGS
jgi:O-antigen ligase